MPFQTSTNQYQNTKYIVDAIVGSTPYATIQAAINAANAAGVPATIFVRAGAYTENLTLYDGIELQGSNAIQTTITGIHTPPNAGRCAFINIGFISGTHVLTSAAAGTATITFSQCKFTLTNGYVCNMTNWTGTILFEFCSDASTINGLVLNTATAAVTMNNNTFGVGTANPLTINGVLTIFNSAIGCSVALSGTAISVVDGGSSFLHTLTMTDDASVSIANSRFSTGADTAIVASSTLPLLLTDVNIATSNVTAIGGTGSVQSSLVNFSDSFGVAGTITPVLDGLTATGLSYMQSATVTSFATAGVVMNAADGVLSTTTSPTFPGSITSTVGDLTLTDGDVIITNRDAATTSPIAYFKKYRVAAALTSGDLTGTVKFGGYDGTQVTDSARITSTSSGTIASTRVAGDLKFYTHPDSAAADPTLRMTIASTGAVTIAAPDSGDTLTAIGLYSKAVGATAQALLVDSTGMVGGLAGAANTIFVGGTKPSFTATPQCTNLTLTGGLKLPATASSTVGVITQKNAAAAEKSLIHTYGNNGAQDGYNLFIGLGTGNFSLTLGTSRFNTGVGSGPVGGTTGLLGALTTGSANAAFGYSGLVACSTGTRNVAFGGINVLYSLTQGTDNIGCGSAALYRLLTGSYNIAIGSSTAAYTDGAGSSYTGAESNNIVISNLGTVGESNAIRIGTQGAGAGQQQNTWIAGIYTMGTALGGTAKVTLVDSTGKVGGLAGAANTVFVGGTTPTFTATPQCTDLTLTGKLDLPTTASATVGVVRINSEVILHRYGDGTNIFVGRTSGNFSLSGAISNTGIGNQTLTSLTDGDYNTAVGFQSLYSVTSGVRNSACSFNCLTLLTTGDRNTAFGSNAGVNLTTGSNNVFIGASDGADNGAGNTYTGAESNNICILNKGVVGESNKIRIGTSGTGAYLQNDCWIAGTYAPTTAIGGTAKVMLVDSADHIGGLAGTAGQVLQGGTTPVFSTATYPATTAQGDLLSSTTDNVIVVLAKDTNATRYLSNTGANNNAAWAQVALATGVSGVLPFLNGGYLPASTEIAADTYDLAINTSYIVNNANMSVCQLPGTAAVGSMIEVIGKSAAMWKIESTAAKNMSEGASTTSGAGGKVEATQQFTSIMLKCITADADWVIVSRTGTVTIA